MGRLLCKLNYFTGRSVQVRLQSGSDYNQFLQLAVQAAFDWVAFNRSNLVTLSVIPTSKFTIVRSCNAIILA